MVEGIARLTEAVNKSVSGRRRCGYTASMRHPALLVVLAAPLLGGAAPALVGNGVQIYACQSMPAGPAWHLVAPEATLSEAGGRDVIHHFAGPSWQAEDGSVVVGEVVATSPGAAGSIPWLVLRAKAHRGVGRLAGVTYVVRSQTEGGLAPAGGCDKDHLGAQVRVAYRAIYTFFGGA